MWIFREILMNCHVNIWVLLPKARRYRTDEKSSEKRKFKGRVKGPKNSTMRVTGFEEFASYSAQRTAEFQIILPPSKVAFYPWNTSGSCKNECGKTTNDFWLKSLVRLKLTRERANKKIWNVPDFVGKNMKLKSFQRCCEKISNKILSEKNTGLEIIKKEN